MISTRVTRCVGASSLPHPTTGIERVTEFINGFFIRVNGTEGFVQIRCKRAKTYAEQKGTTYKGMPWETKESFAVLADCYARN